MKPDLPTLRALRDRVRQATGALPDEVVGQVICAVHGVPFHSVQIATGGDGSPELNVRSGKGSLFWGGYRSRCPDVSIDAAVALVERVLGADFEWRVERGVEDGVESIQAEVSAFGRHPIRRGATPALALLDALLSALIARAENGEAW